MSRLTVRELGMITSDLVNGAEPRVTGPEADKFRESLKKDIKFAEENGAIIDIPAEWEIGDPNDTKEAL